MADTEVMRKFLISLGFAVDKVTQSKFDSTVNKSDATVKKLAGGVLAAGVAAQVMVERYARSFEKLYYLSQRTGTSPTDIKAASVAGKQIGLGAEALESTINTLSRNLKSQPGLAEFLQGITGKQVTGAPTTKVLTDLIGALKSQPDFYAFQVAQRAGIDPDTYLQLKNNLTEFLAAQEREKQLLKDNNVDLDKQTETLKEYSNILNRLGNQAEVVGLKFATKLLPVFEKLANITGFALENISKLLDDNPEAKTVNDQVSNWAAAPWDLGVAAGNNIRERLFGAGDPASRRFSGKITDERPSSPPSGMGTRGSRNNNPGNIEYGDFARRHGATGSDGRFAIFPDMATGQAALSALLGSYHRRGFDTIDEIVGRYAPASDNNNTGNYSKFLSNRLGVNGSTPLRLDQLGQLTQGIGLYESGINLGAGGPSINQTNNITVNGSSDPQQTGRIILGNQQRVNGDLARNLKGATR